MSTVTLGKLTQAEQAGPNALLLYRKCPKPAEYKFHLGARNRILTAQVWQWEGVQHIASLNQVATGADDAQIQLWDFSGGSAVAGALFTLPTAPDARRAILSGGIRYEAKADVIVALSVSLTTGLKYVSYVDPVEGLLDDQEQDPTQPMELTVGGWLEGWDRSFPGELGFLQGGGTWGISGWLHQLDTVERTRTAVELPVAENQILFGDPAAYTCRKLAAIGVMRTLIGGPAINKYTWVLYHKNTGKLIAEYALPLRPDGFAPYDVGVWAYCDSTETIWTVIERWEGLNKNPHMLVVDIRDGALLHAFPLTPWIETEDYGPDIVFYDFKLDVMVCVQGLTNVITDGVAGTRWTRCVGYSGKTRTQLWNFLSEREFGSRYDIRGMGVNAVTGDFYVQGAGFHGGGIVTEQKIVAD